MAQTRKNLLIPVIVLLVAAGATVAAIGYDWGRPDAPNETARSDDREKRADRGEVAPAADETDPAGTTREEGATPADEPTPVEVKAPDGVVAPEGEGVVGILVDGEGNPIRRASVSLRRDLRSLVTKDPNDAARVISTSIRLDGSGFMIGGREAGITDRQGRFAVRKPGKKGRYDVTFKHADHAPHTVEGVDWVPGTRIDLGVIRMPSGGAIYGFVRDDAGKPVAGARVWKKKAADGRTAGVRTSFQAVSVLASGDGDHMVYLGGGRGEPTDDEGYFEIEKVPPGTYSLHAQKKGTAEAVREKLVVGEGKRTGPIQLVVSQGLRITGTVVDERGSPVPHARIMAFRKAGMNSTSARADAQGAFELKGLSPGNLNLSVFGGGMWGGPRGSQEVEAGASGVRLVLKQGLTVAGRIVDAATGKSVPGARVTLARKEGDTMNRQTTFAMEGGFRFGNAKPGEVTIEVSAKGYEPATEGPHMLVEGRSLDDLLIRLQAK